MFRFVVNVSLIISLAAADVIAHDALTIGKIASAAPARRLAMSTGSGGDELSNLPSLLSKLLGLSFHFIIPMAFNFFTPMEFLAYLNAPETFDVANCRMTIDLSQFPVGTKCEVGRNNKTIIVRVTPPGGAPQDVVKRVISPPCLANFEKASHNFNQANSVLTIDFPQASPTGASNLFSPTGEEVALTSSDDVKELTPSEDDNELQEDDGAGDSIKGNLTPRPFSVITT